MAEQVTLQELEKAAGNLAKITEFVAQHRSGTIDPDGERALATLREAAMGLGRMVNEQMYQNSIEAEAESPQLAAAIPDGRLQVARIEKFSGFIAQLDSWFKSRSGFVLPQGGGEPLRQIHSALVGLCKTVDTIWQVEPEAASPTTQPPPAEDEYVEVDRGAQLVLEDTDERPLLQEFKGVRELTPIAEELLDGFLADNKIEMALNERRRLNDKVLRWLESTPDGQLLVLKISGIHGRPEPYSSYRPKPSPVGFGPSEPEAGGADAESAPSSDSEDQGS